METPGLPEGFLRNDASGITNSLRVRRLTHQFQLRLQHGDALLGLGFRQARAEGFRLIGIESELPKQGCLFGGHEGGVRALRHHTTMVPTTIRSARSGAMEEFNPHLSASSVK